MYRQRVIGGVILLAAICVAALLIFVRSAPEEKPPEQIIPLVQTTALEIRSGNLMVKGSGTVSAREELNLAAEVAGKLIYVNPNLRQGQSVRKDAVLFRIDTADYRNAVQTAQADVASQQVALLQAEEEVALAKAELERFDGRQRRVGAFDSVDGDDYAARILPPAALRKTETEPNEEGPISRNGLATRQPQLQSARASLRRAQAQLSNAQIALQRTVVRAPFSGVVRSEQIALGSYVAPGQSLGSLVGDGQLEAVIPLSAKEAALIPALWSGARSGIPASVFAEYGGVRYRWQAYVDRASSVLDPQTRTIDIFLRIPNPRRGVMAADQQTSVDQAATRAPPLFVGSFVDAEITGRALDEYAILPLAGLRPDNQVWLVRKGRLHIAKVDILQRTDRNALISIENLRDGSGSKPVVILSNLRAPTEGQQVRLAKSTGTAAGKKAPKKAPKKPADQTKNSKPTDKTK